MRFNEHEYGRIEVGPRLTKYWLRRASGTACRWVEANDCRRRMMVTRDLTHGRSDADMCHLFLCVVFGMEECPEFE